MISIPVEFLKDPVIARSILENIDFYDIQIPLIKRNISISNESKIAKLTRTNRASLDEDLSDENIEKSIKRYIKSDEFFNYRIDDVRKYYLYRLSGNSLNNRFNNFKKTLIAGVGVDGSGEHPKNFTQENKDLELIKETAEKVNKWNVGNEELLEQSIANVIFWQSSNFSQLPLGTPTQVVSAIIQLTNCDIPKSSGTFYEYLPMINGDKLIVDRRECSGLQYLLDGNKYDLDDKSFNGKAAFLKHSFRRFFYSPEPTKRGIKIKAGAAKIDVGRYAYELCSPKNMFGDDFMKDLMGLLNGTLVLPSPNEYKKVKYAAIMMIYALCFSYGAYIYNLYDVLINNIKNEDLKNSYNLGRLEAVKSFMNLVNFAINKNFKLGVDDIQDMIIATAEEKDGVDVEVKDKKGAKVSAGPGYGEDKYELKAGGFLKAIKRMGLDELKGNIYIGFKDSSNYENILEDEGRVNDDMFKKENFPIVFTDQSDPAAFDNIIDYRETAKRFIPFLLMDSMDKIPTLKDKTPIAVGAPYQNEDILDETSEALEGWYEEVIISKNDYLIYMHQKIAIFTSSVLSKMIKETRDLIYNQLRIIGDTIASSTEKDLECVNLINKIANRYREFRKQEVKLVSDKSILVDNKYRILGNKPEDYPKQYARAIKRLHFGVEAVFLVEVAKLSYQIFTEKNPTLVLCSDFEGNLDKRISDIDLQLGLEMKKILTRKYIQYEKKYGANALKNKKVFTELLTLKTIPPAPSEYSKQILELIAAIRSGANGVAASYSATGSLAGQRVLKIEQRMKVETPVFWKNLFFAFNSRFLFIPFVKLNAKGGYEDENFYLMDVFRSMVENKLYKIDFDANFREIMKKLYQKGYIMFSNTTAEIDSPSNWKAINSAVFLKFFKKGSRNTFDNPRQIRDAFFNMLANNKFLSSSLTVDIPVKSKISQLVQTFCKKVVLKEKFSLCDILISREQFAKTVQPNLVKLEILQGMDFASGTSYAQFTPLVDRSDLVKR